MFIFTKLCYFILFRIYMLKGEQIFPAQSKLVFFFVIFIFLYSNIYIFLCVDLNFFSNIYIYIYVVFISTKLCYFFLFRISMLKGEQIFPPSPSWCFFFVIFICLYSKIYFFFDLNFFFLIYI